MAKLPTTLGQRATPTPQRRVWSVDNTQLAQATADIGRSTAQAGQDMVRVGQMREESAEKDAILDTVKRENQAQQKLNTSLYGDGQTEGIYSRTGGNALESQKAFEERWESIRNEAMEGVTHPKAQAALNRSLMGMETSALGNIQRFVQKERKTYSGNLLEEKIGLDGERVYTEYNNPETLQDSLKSARSSAIALAKINGAKEGDLIWNNSLRKAESDIYTSQLSGMLTAAQQGNDYDQFSNAKALYDKYQAQGKILPEKISTFDKLFNEIMPTVEAHKVIQGVMGGQNYNDNIDQIYSGLIMQESSGQQFTAEGVPTQSEKGAIGIAQIMPDTGPEAAKMAGVAWDEERFKTDADYNARLGKAYLKGQVDKYGDIRLGLAAYNAGPTVVKDWMEGTNKSGKNEGGLKIGDPSKGETTVEEFISRIPFDETRNYVSGVLEKSDAPVHSGMIDMKAVMKATEGMKPAVAEKAMAMAQKRNQAIVDARKFEQEEAEIRVFDAIDAGQEPSAQDMARLSETAQKQVRSYIELHNGWRGVTPEEELARDVYFDRIATEYARDPQSIRAQSIVDLRGNLNPDDFEKAMTWRQKAAEPQTEENKLFAATEGEVNLVIKKFARDMKIDGNEGKLGEFQRAYRTRLSQKERALGRKLTAEELYSLGDGLVEEVAFEGAEMSLWRPSSVVTSLLGGGQRTVRQYQMTGEEDLGDVIVPDDWAEQFTDVWRRKYGNESVPPTDDIIKQYYIKDLRKQ